jgi:hypothetical protein
LAVSTELVTTTEAFEALRPEWNDLVSHMERPEIFHYWEWNWFYFRHFRQGDEPFIVTVRDRGKLIGLAPFCIRRARRYGVSVRVVETLAVNLADYRNLLIDGAVHRLPVVDAILDLLHEQGDRWDLIDVSQFNTADSSSAHLLNAAQHRLDWVVRCHILTAVAVRSLRGVRMVENHTRLHRLRNRLKNLRKQGFSFSVGQRPTPDQWSAFADLHRTAWPSSPLHDREGIAFYDDLRQGLADKLEFSFAEHEGKVVAAHFGFVDGDKVYFYQPVMDQAFRQQRVGAALLCAMIEHYAPTHRLFDFLRGMEDYKLWYTDDLSLNLRLVIHRASSVRAFVYNLPEIMRLTLIAAGLPKAAVAALRRQRARLKGKSGE